MRHREIRSAGIGGLDLHAQAWLPDGGARAVIVLAHGLGEHSGRYARTASDLVARGYAVYALDHRGHGRSPGPRANIGRFEHLVSDFCAFAGRATRQHLDTPVVLLGHSMGGAVAFAAALRLQQQQQLRGLILSAPALATGEPVPPLRRLVAHMLSLVAPDTGLLKLQPSHVSRDPVVVRDYAADPLVHHGAIPARTLVELLAAMQAFPAQAPRLSLPTLVLHGTADRLVPLSGVRPLYQTLGARIRTIKYYEGLFHEVLNEPERAQVLDDIEQWLATV